MKMKIEEGVRSGTDRILVYGTPGIGKSTFAAGSPRPLFIDLERGSDQINVARNVDPISTWAEFCGIMQELASEETPYQTIVIDTLDRAEWLCWQHLCENNRVQGVVKPVKTIEEANGGYARGYTAAYEEFRKLFASIEAIGQKRRKRVIMLAHSKLENVPNPGGSDYSRYSLKLHKHVSGMFYEACDAVLFASRNVVVKKEGFHDGKRARAIGEDIRYLFTTETPTHMAKNRYNLPPEMLLSWDQFALAVAQGHSPDLMIESLRKRAGESGVPGLEEKIVGGIDRAAGNTDKLITLKNWMDRQIKKFQDEIDAASAEQMQTSDAE